MKTRTKVLIGALVVVTAYAYGRFSAPEKIKIEKQIVEVEKKVKDEVTDVSKTKHKIVKIVETTAPDGTKKKVTTITDDTSYARNTDSREETDTTRTSTETKEIVKSKSRLHISALAGTTLFSADPTKPVYGAHVSKDILGPISIGVWGLDNRTGGASVGLSF